MKKPIKVLAIVYKLVPAGLENRLMDIIRNIDNKRIQIDVFTYQLEKGLYDDEITSLGGTVYYNPPLNVKNMFWYVKYFRDFLLKHPEYKIVHAHQDAWCSVFCKGAYLAGVPVRIAHSRTAISGFSPEYVLKNIIKLPTRKYANYFFAVSEKAGKWLYGEKNVKKGLVQIWPNAIDSKKFYYKPKSREFVRSQNKWEDRFVIMHVGNFTKPKNHPFILNVFKLVHEKYSDSLLVLIGSGDTTNISKIIEANDLSDCVSMLGKRQDVYSLLQGADVFLFPSIFEGLPGALVEAQASGLPCVISDSIAEEVRITPFLSVLSLRDNIDCWVESILKYKDFKRLNTSSYISEKGFDIDSLTEKLCTFYEAAFKKHDSDYIK